MTNAMIIMMESVKLLEAGVIGSTGRTFTVTDADGSERVLQEPEPIHTFAHWKDLGFSVKKGEHAVAKFPIWKGAESVVKDEDGNETDEKKTRMFMKTACFFTAAQVERMEDRPPKGRKGAARAPRAAKTMAPAVYGNWLS